MLKKIRGLFDSAAKMEQLWMLSGDDLRFIFTGEVEFPDTSQKEHRMDKGQREGILCCLYNLVYQLDLRMSLKDIQMFVSVYGNNLRTLIEQKRLYSNKNQLFINPSEQKLVAYFIKNIMCHPDHNITTIADKRKQYEHLKEIRRWASMVYSAILNQALQPNPQYYKIEAYIDPTCIARIVLVEEDSAKKKIPVTWVPITVDEIPAKLDEIMKKRATIHQPSSKENSLEETYRQDYIKAQEYATQGKYKQAKKLLKRIISSTEVYDFTSGAYVTLANIKINNGEKSKKNKIESLLNKALEINPDNRVAPAVLVTLYLFSGDFGQAQKWLHQCQQHETTKEILERNMEELNQFFQYMLLPGQPMDLVNQDDVMGFFTDALALFPHNIFIRLNAAKLYANREEEYLLKAYDLCKSVINDAPEFFYPYQMIGDLCGAGYLERYKEQEEYYLKALDLLDKSYGQNSELAQEMQEARFLLEGNLISCWLSLEKYEKVLPLTAKRIEENPNNTDLHNRAVALYHLGRYQESIAYCQRELFVGEDESTYILLGRNFYALNDFAKAVMASRKALAFIDQEKLSVLYQDENNRNLLSFTKKSWNHKKLKEIYTLLFISYYRQKEYLNAKAIWQLAHQNYGQDDTIKAWGHTIDAMLEAQNQLALAHKQCEKIKQELLKEKQEQAAKQQVIRKWALELMKIQREEPMDEEIDDRYWDAFEKQINRIITKMRLEIDDRQDYEYRKKTFAQNYPQLSQKSIEFLATAEYLFQYHKNNTIDFAPIMVEFCKVIENELRILLRQNNLTLGQAIFHIEQFSVSPLVKELPRLKEIYLSRNGSAHTGGSTKEKVERIRELLIGSHSLLDTICKLK